MIDLPNAVRNDHAFPPDSGVTYSLPSSPPWTADLRSRIGEQIDGQASSRWASLPGACLHRPKPSSGRLR